MKKKIVIVMLATMCAFSIVGCSNNKKVAKNTETTEIVSETEDEETVKEEKEIVDNIAIKFNDNTISLPMSYTDFLNMGFNCTSLEYDNDTFGNCFLSGKTSASVTDTTDYISFTDNSITIVPIVYNDSDEDKAIKDCTIIGFQFNNSIVVNTEGVTDINSTEETSDNGVIKNDGTVSFIMGGKTITTGVSSSDEVKSFLNDKEFIDNSKCAFIPSYDDSNTFIGFKYFTH